MRHTPQSDERATRQLGQLIARDFRRTTDRDTTRLPSLVPGVRNVTAGTRATRDDGPALRIMTAGGVPVQVLDVAAPGNNAHTRSATRASAGTTAFHPLARGNSTTLTRAPAAPTVTPASFSSRARQAPPALVTRATEAPRARAATTFTASRR